MSLSAGSSISEDTSDARKAFVAIMALKRSCRQRSQRCKVKLLESENDDYTNTLHADLSGRALCTRIDTAVL